MALTSSTNWLMNGIIGGAAVGFSVPIGNFIGAKLYDKARDVVRQSVIAIFIIGAVLTGIMLAVAPHLPHIAAPDTPIPAPHIWNVMPNTLISRGAYISRKFSTMFIRLVDTLKTSGVAVSPVQRSMLEHICIDVLAMYARHTIEI